MTIPSYPSSLTPHRASSSDDIDVRAVVRCHSTCVDVLREVLVRAPTRPDSLELAWFEKCSKVMIALACTFVGYVDLCASQ
jgi:hypothetical protein